MSIDDALWCCRAPSAHLSFSLAKVRLAESEAARDVARDAVARAAQEHIREDRTGTAAGLEGTLELEGSAEHAAWEVCTAPFFFSQGALVQRTHGIERPETRS